MVLRVMKGHLGHRIAICQEPSLLRRFLKSAYSFETAEM